MAKKTTFSAIVSTSDPDSATSSSATGVTINDFVAFLPRHVYIFTVCREIWIGAGVNARLPPVQVLTKSGKPKRDKDGNFVYQSATKWLDKNRGVDQMMWCPGQPMLINDRVVVDGGWIERKGVTTFNWYRPPRIKLGDAAKAETWINHVYKIFHAEDAKHIIKWLAHRVQRPAEKINHALFIGGDQGIGKDTMLEPLKHAVGNWNFHDVSPTHMFGPFNNFAKSVILRVNEGRDLGDTDRFKFYDHTKNYAAAPPDVLRVNEKFIPEYYVSNVIGLIITSNHKIDGIYLPSNDRRHYVAWSDRHKEDFTNEYWEQLWNWYETEDGYAHVAAYLSGLDISDFDPKAPPPKTQAFWDIVHASQAPENAELADVIDAMQPPEGPDALTPKQITATANGTTAEWLTDRKSRRALPHRLERCGYICVPNPDAKDGYWRINKERQPIYVKSELSGEDRLKAARKFYEGGATSKK